MSVRIRPMTMGDIPHAMRLKDAAQWNQTADDWLRSLLEEAPDFALAERKETEVIGYTFGRRGSLADHLGPWMARNEDVAAMLLDEFLRRSGREPVFVDCVRGNPWAVPLVKALGFQFSRPLTRMFRGTDGHAGRPELLCAVLGPEFG
jgi:hypothetical protein